jgi:hypothetical protein
MSDFSHPIEDSLSTNDADSAVQIGAGMSKVTLSEINDASLSGTTVPENDNDDDDDDEEDNNTTEIVGGDEKKKKKKKKGKKKKKSGAAASSSSNLSASGATGSLLPVSRLLTGYTDYYIKYGQTPIPTIPVADLFPQGKFPEVQNTILYCRIRVFYHIYLILGRNSTSWTN